MLSDSNLQIIGQKMGTKQFSIVSRKNAKADSDGYANPVMDGFDATLLIRKLHPQIPAFAQTAFSESMKKRKHLKSGATICFQNLSISIS
jgi:hypothetical protein